MQLHNTSVPRRPEHHHDLNEKKIIFYFMKLEQSYFDYFDIRWIPCK